MEQNSKPELLTKQRMKTFQNAHHPLCQYPRGDPSKWLPSSFLISYITRVELGRRANWNEFIPSLSTKCFLNNRKCFHAKALQYSVGWSATQICVHILIRCGNWDINNYEFHFHQIQKLLQNGFFPYILALHTCSCRQAALSHFQ